MSSDPGPPFTDPTLELYETYRSYVRHEDNLVNFRTTWFVAIQGILMGVYSFVLQKKFEIIASLCKDCNPTEAAKINDIVRSITANKENLLGEALSLVNYVIHLTPVFGILQALLTLMSVAAAFMAADGVKNAAKKHEIKFNTLSLPGIAGGGKTKLHYHGFAAPFLWPVLVAVFWVLSFARTSFGIRFLD